MEVADETQAVLLEGMEGAQYITIQRADPDSLGKGVPLFTLNGELISDGMVVDMMNGVGTDYTTGTHFYETDDVLPHVLTEEDRRLAAALVAVQLQQQQKHQIQIHTNHEETNLQDVTHLENMTPINTYSIQAIHDPNPPLVYPLIQSFKRSAQNMKTEFIKCEDDVDISAESSEDAVPAPGLKRLLPHKKRIPPKLKQQSKKRNKREKTSSNQERINNEAGKMQANGFKCEICGNKFNGQLSFFEHLKSHYEPLKNEKKVIMQPMINDLKINVQNSLIQGAVEEFSEPEDLMEGIRGVVEETVVVGDDDDDDNGNGLLEDPLPENTNDSTMWNINVGQQGHVGQTELKKPTIVNQTDLPKTADDKNQAPSKKKKSKLKKKVDELSCPDCGRIFHHKNSLIYHMRSHSGERPHQCEVCGKSFFAASALKVHKRLHSGDKPYKCEDCGRHFRQWGDLKYHSTSLHSEQRQFQCEYCGKDFARKYSLIVHRRIHTGEKNYRCEYCNKTFRASSYLQNHRRIHTGEKPHPCEVCGKPFRVRSDMKRHMLTHTRAASRNDRVPKIKSQPDDESNESDNELMRKQSLTINEIAHELKLEVEPSVNAATLVGATVSGSNNAESILPHVSVQSLGYESQVEDARDPLDPVDRTNDSLNFDMQLYSINI